MQISLAIIEAVISPVGFNADLDCRSINNFFVSSNI